MSGAGWKGENVLVGLLIFVFLLVFPWPGITAIIFFFNLKFYCSRRQNQPAAETCDLG